MSEHVEWLKMAAHYEEALAEGRDVDVPLGYWMTERVCASLRAAADHIASLEARVDELEKVVQEVAEDDCYETLGVGDGCGQCIACRSLKLLNHPEIPDSSKGDGDE